MATVVVPNVYCPHCHLKVALVGINSGFCTSCGKRLNSQEPTSTVQRKEVVLRNLTLATARVQ